MRRVFFKGKTIAKLVKWNNHYCRPVNHKERIKHLWEAFLLQQFLERNEKIREICLLAQTKGDIVYFGKNIKVVSNPVFESHLPVVKDELPF